MEEESPCLCLPVWMSQLVTAVGCSFCGKRFSAAQDHYAGTLLIPCCNVTEVVHFIGLEFHIECAAAWQRSANERARLKLCDYVPFSVQRIQSEPRFSQLLTAECVKNHVFTEQNCAWCRARSQTHVPFVLDCDRCHRIRYCDQGCKDAHKKKHKQVCDLL